MSLRPEWTELARNITAGAEWLRTKQPKGARVYSHFGPSGVHVGGGVRLSFSQGADGRDVSAGRPGTIYFGGGDRKNWGRSSAIVNLMVGCATKPPETPFVDGHYTVGSNPEYERKRAEYELIGDEPPFTDDELDSIQQLLTDAGLTVTERWRCQQHEQRGVSYRLKFEDTSPSLRKAGTAYSIGCPVHKDGPLSRCPDDCDAVEKANAKLVMPSYVAAPFLVFNPTAPPQAPDDDTNLEAVRLALITIRPLLEELGMTPQMLAAGRRGRIDGEPGDLTFEATGGHGVLFPAELAQTLVELALRGYNQ